MQNHHLNLFRFYNINEDEGIIENNLTRALFLCLQNEAIFLNEFFKLILKENYSADFNYLFSSIDEYEKIEIDLQVDVKKIQVEEFRKVYAVAITQDEFLDLTLFFQQTRYNDNKINITDAVVFFKDIIFIFEIKKNNENSLEQLYNQIKLFEDEKKEIIPVNISWKSIVRTIDKIRNFGLAGGINSIFLSDFLVFIESKYTNWFDSKPLLNVSFPKNFDTKEYHQFSTRMKQAITIGSSELLHYNNRLGIKFSLDWASEILIEPIKLEDGSECVFFSIYPASTKQQGYAIFPKRKILNQNLNFVLDNLTIPFLVRKTISFRHFNRFITGLTFDDSDTFHDIHNEEFFQKQTGQWKKDKWSNLEQLLDSIFKIEFSWKEKCNWEHHFINSERTYCVMTLSYEVGIYIPYKSIQSFDRSDNSLEKLRDFLDSLFKKFEDLV